MLHNHTIVAARDADVAGGSLPKKQEGSYTILFPSMGYENLTIFENFLRL